MSILAHEEARELCERVLAMAQTEQTEVVLLGRDERLTRFANSEIHQNVAESDLEVRIRVLAAGRTGICATNVTTDDGLREALARASQLASLSPPDPELAPLPYPAPLPSGGGFVPETAGFTADQRAQTVEQICRRATQADLLAFGAFQTGVRQVTVANSHGTFAHHVGTLAELDTVVMGEGTSSYAARCSARATDIDGDAIGLEAVERAILARNPREMPPGDYPVLLMPYAVADLVEYLAYMGLGAGSLLDGTSFMCGKLDSPIVSKQITLIDDGQDPQGIPMPFDYEGIPRLRLPLIEQGIARAVAHDSSTARRSATATTGHALLAPNPDGPMPMHLHLLPGHSSLEAMLAALDRGLWVTRFHYVNVLSPRQTVLTGMTRDGTFWVEGGKVVGPVKNLRFTQNVLDALQSTRMVGGQTQLVLGHMGASSVPPLLLDRFHFSSKTDF